MQIFNVVAVMALVAVSQAKMKPQQAVPQSAEFQQQFGKSHQHIQPKISPQSAPYLIKAESGFYQQESPEAPQQPQVPGQQLPQGQLVLGVNEGPAFQVALVVAKFAGECGLAFRDILAQVNGFYEATAAFNPQYQQANQALANIKALQNVFQTFFQGLTKFAQSTMKSAQPEIAPSNLNNAPPSGQASQSTSPNASPYYILRAE